MFSAFEIPVPPVAILAQAVGVRPELFGILSYLQCIGATAGAILFVWASDRRDESKRLPTIKSMTTGITFGL
jgi:hypothetical protein